MAAEVRPARAIRQVQAASLAAIAALLVLASGCGSDGSEPDSAGGEDSDGDGSGDGDGDGSAPPPSPLPLQCSVTDDCIAVSSLCCECPTFAVPMDSTFAGACEQVECAPPEGCPAVEPACLDSQCELICSPVTTGRVCDRGFARDSFGCLLDACREDAPGHIFACEEDVDCSEVPADCCGCESGGASTAVATRAIEEYLSSLGCDRSPECPGVNVCDASLVPRCVAQSCTLGPAGDDGDDGDGIGEGADDITCGVPDHPSCPEPQVCVLNHPEANDATRMGVGTCRDP